MKKFSIYSLQIFSCLLFSIFILNLYVNSTILNKDYHKKLFLDHNIYNNTHETIKSSYNIFIKNLQSYSPKTYNKYNSVLMSLKESLTQDIVNYNLNMFTLQFFDYINNKKNSLPDIYLNKSNISKNSAFSADEDFTIKSIENLESPNKLNLNTILFLTNRTDIYYYLKATKLIVFTYNEISIFSINLFLLILILFFLIKNNIFSFVQNLKIHLFILSILHFILSIILFTYCFFILKKNIYPITMSLPIDNKISTSYIQNIFYDFIIFNFLLFIIFIISFVSILYVEKKLSIHKLKFKKIITISTFSKKNRLYLLRSSIIIALILFFFFSFSKYEELYSYYSSNNLKTLLTKLSNSSETTTIISAEDEFLYSIEVKTVDEKTNSTLKNIKIILSGNLKNNENFSSTQTTNTDGIAKFDVEKGKFKLSLLPDYVPKEYEIPAPLFYDIKTPGKKIVKIKLKQREKKEKGLVEIQLYDNNGTPIPKIELYTILKSDEINLKEEKNISITNINGTALFSLPEGKYKLNFSNSNETNYYEIPDFIEVDVVSNTNLKYTLQLINIENDPSN